MKVLFLTTHSYLPQRSGGSESSTDELCKMLLERGHKAAVLSSLLPHNKVWFLNRVKSKISNKSAPQDNFLGYPVYRSWSIQESLDEVIANFSPDCVVTQAGNNIPLIRQLVQRNIKTFVYLRDVEFHQHGGNYFSHKFLHYLANSDFTARRFQETFGLNALAIPPLINQNRYKVFSSREKVLFVCPKQKKGLDIALNLAKKNPDIPFIFLESWELTSTELAELRNQLSFLPNVELMHTRADIKPIYAMTKLTLVPSRCEEAWGRIASEAQISSIPVLASNQGGLPESVGNGGLLHKIEDPVETWSASLRKIWDDSAFYEQLCRKAQNHSQRKKIQPDYLIDSFIHYLSS